MEIVYIVGALAFLWFFGSAINNILKGAGELASKEFEYHKDAQDFRLAKDYDRLSQRIEDANITAGKATVRAKLAMLNEIDGETEQ